MPIGCAARCWSFWWPQNPANFALGPNPYKILYFPKTCYYKIAYRVKCLQSQRLQTKSMPGRARIDARRKVSMKAMTHFFGLMDKLSSYVKNRSVWTGLGWSWAWHITSFQPPLDPFRQSLSIPPLKSNQGVIIIPCRVHVEEPFAGKNDIIPRSLR